MGGFRAWARDGAPSRQTLSLIAIAAVGATVVYVWFVLANFYGIENPDHSGHWPWIAAALVWSLAGAFTWTRWPASRIGRVMILVGFSHYTYIPGLIPTAGTWLLSGLLEGLTLLLIAYAFLSYPSGRLANRTDRRLFLALVAWWAISAVVSVATWDHHLNPVVLIRDESLASTIRTVMSIIGSVVNLVVVARVVTHWRDAPAARRPLYTPVLLAVVPYLVALAAGWLDVVIGPNVATDLANGWPGAVLPNLGFPIAVAFILWRTQAAAPERRPAEASAA